MEKSQVQESCRAEENPMVEVTVNSMEISPKIFVPITSKNTPIGAKILRFLSQLRPRIPILAKGVPRPTFFSRGPILGRNQDKSFKSFPSCHSHSPLQLCLEISISLNSRNLLNMSSNSRNLLHMSSNSCNLLHMSSNSCNHLHMSSNSRNLLCIYTEKFMYTVKEKAGKPDRKPPPSLWFKKSVQNSQIWKLSRLCPETSTKLYVHEFGFRIGPRRKKKQKIGMDCCVQFMYIHIFVQGEGEGEGEGGGLCVLLMLWVRRDP
jgi:hypothetical protein